MSYSQWNVWYTYIIYANGFSNNSVPDSGGSNSAPNGNNSAPNGNNLGPNGYNSAPNGNNSAPNGFNNNQNINTSMVNHSFNTLHQLTANSLMLLDDKVDIIDRHIRGSTVSPDFNDTYDIWRPDLERTMDESCANVLRLKRYFRDPIYRADIEECENYWVSSFLRTRRIDNIYRNINRR